MMKKMLLTLTAAGVLAVPAGVALAQDDGTVPTGSVATCQDHDRSQDRDRSHQQYPIGVQAQERAQHQYRINDGDCTGDCTGTQAGEGAQVRSADGTGLEAREAKQVRSADGTGLEAREASQVRSADGTGSQAQYRNGGTARSGNGG
jgi:hypothetical protein